MGAATYEFLLTTGVDMCITSKLLGCLHRQKQVKNWKVRKARLIFFGRSEFWSNLVLVCSKLTVILSFVSDCLFQSILNFSNYKN